MRICFTSFSMTVDFPQRGGPVSRIFLGFILAFLRGKTNDPGKTFPFLKARRRRIYNFLPKFVFRWDTEE